MNRYEKEKIEQREDNKEKHNEETLDEVRLRALEECHYLKKQVGSEEVYYWCELSDHPCTVEYDDGDCEEYEDFLSEIKTCK